MADARKEYIKRVKKQRELQKKEFEGTDVNVPEWERRTEPRIPTAHEMWMQEEMRREKALKRIANKR